MSEVGPERKTVFLRLPFTGINSAKLQRQITRMIRTVAPSINVRFIFVPVYKLSKLSKLKCQFPLLSRSGVVYQVNCSDCAEFYVGMTIRRLQQRLHEHAESDCSALRKHALEVKHDIDYANPRILASDSKRDSYM